MALWKCPVCGATRHADYAKMCARSGDDDVVEGPDCRDCGALMDGPCPEVERFSNDE